MASHNSPNPSSRIPVAVRNPSPSTHHTDLYINEKDEENILVSLQKESCDRISENGNLQIEKDELSSPNAHDKSGQGFETFLMTGEMIIRTNPSKPKSVPVGASPTPVRNSKGSGIPKLGHSDRTAINSKGVSKEKGRSSNAAVSSPGGASKIPGLVKHQNSSHKTPNSPQSTNLISPDSTMAACTNEPHNYNFVQAPVAELEEFSDLSQSSSDEESTMENGHSHPGSPQGLPPHSHAQSQPSPSSSTSKKTVELANKPDPTSPDAGNQGLSDTSFSEPPSSGDSGFIHDGHTSDTDGPDKAFANSLGSALIKAEKDGESSEARKDHNNKDLIGSGNSDSVYDHENVVVASSGSDEKFHNVDNKMLVRTSKSHENYLQGGISLALVNIDIDDSLAYSLDTLTFHDSSQSSLDKAALEATQVSRSLDNSPEKKDNKLPGSDRDFVAGFKNFEERPTKDEDGHRQFINSSNRNKNVQPFNSSANHDSLALEDEEDRCESVFSDSEAANISILSDESDLESLYHQPSKAVDRPSALRLAKRLFHLEGFKKSDVSRHLSKK